VAEFASHLTNQVTVNTGRLGDRLLPASQSRSRIRALGGSVASLRSGTARTNLNQGMTHFVLYLNLKTFESEALAEDLRAIRAAGIPVLMLHERDVERNGCEFDRFFHTTPNDLIADGLYAKLAIPMFEREARDVSLALVAKALGATKKRRSAVLQSIRSTRGASTVTSTVRSTTTPPPSSVRSDGLEAIERSTRMASMSNVLAGLSSRSLPVSSSLSAPSESRVASPVLAPDEDVQNSDDDRSTLEI